MGGAGVCLLLFHLISLHPPWKSVNHVRGGGCSQVIKSQGVKRLKEYYCVQGVKIQILILSSGVEYPALIVS